MKKVRNYLEREEYTKAIECISEIIDKSLPTEYSPVMKDFLNYQKIYSLISLGWFDWANEEIASFSNALSYKHYPETKIFIPLLKAYSFYRKCQQQQHTFLIQKSLQNGHEISQHLRSLKECEMETFSLPENQKNSLNGDLLLLTALFLNTDVKDHEEARATLQKSGESFIDCGRIFSLYLSHLIEMKIDLINNNREGFSLKLNQIEKRVYEANGKTSDLFHKYPTIAFYLPYFSSQTARNVNPSGGITSIVNFNPLAHPSYLPPRDNETEDPTKTAYLQMKDLGYKHLDYLFSTESNSS